MNYSIILKMLSMVTGIMALAFSLCAGICAARQQSALEAGAMPSWICSVAFAAVLALAFYLPSRKAPSKLYKKEAMCIVGLAWILASLVGALPYILILDCPFSTAFFESTSGLTTTGSSVFGNFDNFPQSLMFWRCFSHWIGGLGVLFFFVAILSYLGFGGRILFASESSTNAGGGLETTRIQNGAFAILFIYTAISVVCLAVFRFCGMGWFDGVCHMFTTVSTGGFSVFEDSIAHYGSNLIYWAVTLFMFVGGVSFALMIYVLRGDFHKVMRNTEFWTYVVLILVFGALISAMTFPGFASDSSDIFDSFTHAVFQTVSIITTTGLSSCQYQLWPQAALVLLLILTLIGGCAGSTSGGIKVSRFVAALRITRRSVEKSFRPWVVRNVFLNGKNLGDDETDLILSYTVIYSLTALASFAILALCETELSLTACISSVLSSLSNVGPGFAEVGPDKNYGFMNPVSKIFLSMLMIMGRLEFYAILVLFMPSLWKKFQ